MAGIKLVFDLPAKGPGSPVALVFGEDGTPSTEVYSVSTHGRITGLRGHMRLRQGLRVRTAGRITGLRGHVALRHDINVSRPTVGHTAGRLQQGLPAAAAMPQHFQQAATVGAAALQTGGEGLARAGEVLETWQQALRLSHAALARDQQGVRIAGAVVQAFQQGLARRLATADHMQQGERVALEILQSYQEAIRLRGGVHGRFQQGLDGRAALLDRMGQAIPVRVDMPGRLQQAMVPLPGLYVPVVPQPEPCYVPSLPAHLVFADAAAASLPAHLVFCCCKDEEPEPGQTIVVPVRKVYFMQNSVSLHRVETGVELQAHGFRMSLDYQSWTWTWSASLHESAGAHLGRDSAGDPAELEVQINGIPFRLRLERVAKDRRFMPQVRWAVSGKGKAAILGAPWAPTMSFSSEAARTAQQLAEHALTINGVSIGWALDWGIVDWQVPGGTWALQGSYIDAVNDIAAAAGGYVQPHPTDAVLRVLPRYPSAPWNWGSITPDYEIPGALAENVGTEYVDQPDYNRIYVGGIGVGVHGPFTRTGTAGEKLAPQVNHALITDADVWRARAIAELGNTGRQEHHSLRLPVLQELGLIMPGQFVRHVGDQTVKGLVRSVDIEWSRPVLRQTIGIETHAD